MDHSIVTCSYTSHAKVTHSYTSHAIVTESEEDIKSAEVKDDYICKWKELYSKENAPYLHKTRCIYVSLVIMQNAIYKETFDKQKKDIVSVLKVGYTETSSSSVYKRLYSQFDTYDAIWTIPLLVIQIDNTSDIESKIHKKLEKHKVHIACKDHSGNYKIPREFYQVTQEVLSIVIDICKSGNILFEEEYDVDENADDIIPKEIDTLLLDNTDSLTYEQQRFIKENKY